MTTRTEREMNDLLDRIGEALRETGVTLEELIESGREIRGQLIAEKYGLVIKPEGEEADDAQKDAHPTLTPRGADHPLTQNADVRRAWEIINALQAENAAHDPDAVFADVTEAVAAVRRKTNGT